MGMVGRVTLDHHHNGIITKHAFPNTVVTEGKALMAGLLVADVGGTGIDFMAIGTGSSTIVAGDTTLGTESVRVGTAGTRTTTTTTQDTATLIGSFSISGNLSLNEAGLFDAASLGSMLSRTTYATISAVSGDSVNATWDVQFT